MENFLTDMSAAGLEHLDYGRVDDSNWVDYVQVEPDDMLAIRDWADRNRVLEIETNKEGTEYSEGYSFKPSHWPADDEWNVIGHFRGTPGGPRTHTNVLCRRDPGRLGGLRSKVRLEEVD